MTMRLLKLAALSLVLACGACGPSEPPQVSPAPTLLTIEETPQNGRARPLPAEDRAFVDINSVIGIQPDPVLIQARFAAVATDTADPEFRRVEAMADSLETVRRLLQAMNNQLPTVRQQIASATTLLRVNPDDRRAEDALRAGLRLHAEILLPLIQFLDERGLDTDAALMNGDPGYEAIGELARRDIEGLGQRLAAAVAEFQRSRPERVPSVQVWAVRSSPDGAPSQLHIDHYDTRQGGVFTPVDKLSMQMTEAEAQRIQRAHDATRAVISLGQELRAVGQQMEGDAVDLARVVRAQADSVRGILDSLPGLEELRQLRNDFAQVAGTTALVAEVDRLIATIEPLTSVRTLQAGIVEQLKQDPSPNVAFAQLAARQQAIRAAIAGLPDLGALRTRLRTELGALEQAAAAVLQGAAAEQRERLSRLVQQQIPSWQRFATRIEEIGALYQQAASKIELVSNLLGLARGTQRLATSDLPLEQIQSTLRTLRADALPKGQMFLGQQVAEGDRVHVRMRVIDPQTQAELITEERNLDIRTYGFFRRFTAGLAFTTRPDADGFAPGIFTSYILHFRRRPDPGATPFHLGTILDPTALGLGFTSVVLTRDTGIELGLGVTATILEDLVQAGYGVNLQTEKGYWMLSTPLLDLVDRARGLADR